MTVAEKIGGFLRPKNVAIFAQPPGTGFAALLLSQVSIPQPGRAAFDLSETEDYERRWTMVRNPIETQIAMNRIRQPDTLTLTGMIHSGAIFSPLRVVNSLARLDKLEVLKLKKILELSVCFIVTPERPYKNMGCVLARERYDDESVGGVSLTLRFEEFQIANPAAVVAEFDLDALGVGAMSSVDMGPQTATDIPDPTGGGLL